MSKRKSLFGAVLAGLGLCSALFYAGSQPLHAAGKTKSYTSSFTVTCNANGAATVNIYLMDSLGGTLGTASMECTPGTTASAAATTSARPASAFAAWNTFVVVDGAWLNPTGFDADLSSHKTTECATDAASGLTGCATVSQ